MANHCHIRQPFLACTVSREARQSQFSGSVPPSAFHAAPTGCFSPIECVRPPGWIHAARAADGLRDERVVRDATWPDDVA